MEIISERDKPQAYCSFCDGHISEVKFLFRQGMETMCPDCVKEIHKLMTEDTHSSYIGDI